MIKNPNGEYGFCLDFRKVNKITRKDLYPIPLMNLDEANTKEATRYNLRRRAIEFKVGDSFKNSNQIIE